MQAIRFALLPFALFPAFAALNSPLHLYSSADREAFRRWFTLLSESQFYSAAPDPEITDCAALVRWSFRQSLVTHDSEWANSIGLRFLPALPSVSQFAWPHTPAGPRLFRTDETSWGQFADATSLRRYNSYFVSLEMDKAEPGDLLFFRQFERAMPAHVMIYIGASQFDPSSQRWLVYHTGPSHASKGEIRKVSVKDLLAHPAPEWRPVPGNSNFLGVFRLNILRD